MKKITFENVSAVYTGGGVWLFWGKLDKERYFLTDDYGCTLILDENPNNFDVSLYDDWQEAHTIQELEGKERERFCDALINRFLKDNPSDDRGGITDTELLNYKRYFKEL